MKGYKTVGLSKASQAKYSYSRKENDRFWKKQGEQEIRKQAKAACDKKAGKNERAFTSPLQEELS